MLRPPNTACSRPAKLRQLSISFDGGHSGRWHAGDTGALGAKPQIAIPLL